MAVAGMGRIEGPAEQADALPSSLPGLGAAPGGGGGVGGGGGSQGRT